MARALRATAFLAVVAMSAACSVKDTTAPPLSGPSELGLSLAVQASPDILTQDGAAQSQIVVVALDAGNQPLRNLSLRLDIGQSGTLVDYGRLSTRNVTTGADGRASATYTAPAAPVVSVDTGANIVTIYATPIGSDYANEIPRQAQIRLVPPGVIIPPPDLVAGFSFSPTSPGELDRVVFTAPYCLTATQTDCVTGTISSFAWDFGDGSRASGQTATHEFVAGNYAVTLTITDPQGRSVSTTKTVQVGVGQNPTAGFVFSPTAPAIGQAVFFNGSSSQASGSRTLVDYRWDFGDGSTGHGLTVSHAFSTPASYTVTLTVYDDAGRYASASQTVAVGLPVASFTYTVAGRTVSFDGSGSSAPSGIARYEWEFGDGTWRAEGVKVSHVFGAAGTYNVTLTITDNNGVTTRTTSTITVQ